MKKREYRGHEMRNRTGRANDWFISFGTRVRWGSIAQCEADIDHIVEHGCMPPFVPGSWA